MASINPVPSKIGPYEIEEEIGHGGMSVVYRAHDTLNDRKIALKVLPPQLAFNEVYLDRFIREGKNGLNLRHPNVVGVFESGESNAYYYIALELATNGTVEDLLRPKQVVFTIDEALNILSQVANGLDYAHQNNVLHRDIKPSNILLTDGKRVFLADFGVAKNLAADQTQMTIPGFSVGTPAYMSPEQARGDQNIDARADIYSLGVVAYQMLTGYRPIDADSSIDPLALLRRIIDEMPRPPEVANATLPPGIAYALKKVLAKSPTQRYQTAGEFMEALQHGLTWVPNQSEQVALDAATQMMIPIDFGPAEGATIQPGYGHQRVSGNITPPPPAAITAPIQPPVDEPRRPQRRNYAPLGIFLGLTAVVLALLALLRPSGGFELSIVNRAGPSIDALDNGTNIAQSPTLATLDALGNNGILTTTGTISTQAPPETAAVVQSAIVTQTHLPENTATGTTLPSEPPTATHTVTAIDTPTAEDIAMAINSATRTPTHTSTTTNRATASNTPTFSPEPTATSTPNWTATGEALQAIVQATLTAIASAILPSPTATETTTATHTPTDVPPTPDSATPTKVDTPTAEPIERPTETNTPTETETPKPADTPTEIETPTSLSTPTVEPTSTPTGTPTRTNTPTIEPTATHTQRPTQTPAPTSTPTSKPTSTETHTPTSKPVRLGRYSPDGAAFAVLLPRDWDETEQRGRYNFVSPDGRSRFFVQPMTVAMNNLSPTELLDAFVRTGELAMVDGIEADGPLEEGITLDDTSASMQGYTATLLGTPVSVRLMSISEPGRSYMVGSIVATDQLAAAEAWLDTAFDLFDPGDPPTATPTITPTTTSSDTPLPSNTPTQTATQTPVASPTNSATPVPTSTPMPTPTATEKVTVEPTATAINTPTPVPPTATFVPTVPKPPGLMTDFEFFGQWLRGDQPYGTFAQSEEQVHSGRFSGKLSYEFPAVQGNFVVFQRAISISGQPDRLTLWVHGNSTQHYIHAWVKDDTGRGFQFSFGQVTHSGWKQMTAFLTLNQDWTTRTLDGQPASTLQYPISLMALVLDGYPDNQAQTGTIYVDDLSAGSGAVANPTPTATHTSSSGGATTVPTATPENEQPVTTSDELLAGKIAYSVINTSSGRYDTYVYRIDSGDRWPYLPDKRQPDFSPDGRLVVNGEGGGADDIIRMSGEGENHRHITTHPEDSHPQWSPSTQSITYASTFQGDGRWRLYWVADVKEQTEGRTLIYNGRELFGHHPIYLENWRIAYQGCNSWEGGGACGIYSADTQGGRPMRATELTDDLPTDNLKSEILFMSNRSGNWDVYLVNWDGSNLRQLTQHPAEDGLATASPDGQQIAFTTNRDGNWSVYVMGIDGSNQRRLFDLQGGYGSGDKDWRQERISWGN
ncbi:MAG: protein kinase [Chloroflexota bacterium]